MVFQRSTIQLLRFPFSYFLMPVYWFALSFVPSIHWERAISVFIILHLLVYPASNGYNSYMDKDEGSIGGISNPLQPTRQLFIASVVLDTLAVLLSFFISGTFAALVLFYIACSRMYSYRGIRLKQYPLLGYITVILNQGALTFFMVYHGADAYSTIHVPFTLLLVASFLIGGFYPITQVYQHEQDAKDGVTTISMLLGKKGTFVFCSIMYAVAFLLLFFYYSNRQQLSRFFILQSFFIPVLVFFFWWVSKVWKNVTYADYQHTMRMNRIASTCTSLAFITLLILNHFG